MGSNSSLGLGIEVEDCSNQRKKANAEVVASNVCRQTIFLKCLEDDWRSKAHQPPCYEEKNGYLAYL